MKVAIHQPEHFPYLGFFQKMAAADIFVILDDVQYSKGSWQNRNRILNNNSEIEYFTVQVEPKAYHKLIKDVEVSEDNRWRRKTIEKLKQNLGEDFSFIYEPNMLLEINMHSITWVMSKLHLYTPMIYSSSLNITTTSTQRLVDICKVLKANEYISGRGGTSYLDESLFANANIKLTYFKPHTINDYSSVYNICKKIVKAPYYNRISL